MASRPKKVGQNIFQVGGGSEDRKVWGPLGKAILPGQPTYHCRFGSMYRRLILGPVAKFQTVLIGYIY